MTSVSVCLDMTSVSVCLDMSGTGLYSLSNLGVLQHWPVVVVVVVVEWQLFSDPQDSISQGKDKVVIVCWCR